MQSNYQKSGSYTTDLVHTDSSVSDSIPTSTSASTLYWNYNNPLTSTTNPIPAHGTPDKIGQYFSPTNSNQTPLDVNVSVDTSIVSGTYENQLLFSAVGNPTTVDYTITFDPNGGTQAITTIEETAKAGVHGITIPSTSDYLPTKTGYTFNHWEIQGSTTANCNDSTICNPGDLLKIYSDEEFTGDVTLKAYYNLNPYTLTVNPNGGTWSGSTSSQSFTQDYGTTKTIANPSATPKYTISYNANSQGASYTASPTSVDRPFSSWALSGAGSFAGGSYTYGAGDGTLTAQYSSSVTLKLPTISRTFATCGWRDGGASGTYYSSGASVTISGNKTFYASCSNITMQQMTSTICSNAATNASATLTDNRDNNTYTIKKLADGKCWMTQNLRLNKSVTLTAANSNVSANTSWSPYTTNCSSTYTSYVCAASAGSTSYGVFYNWYAATAKSGTSGTTGNASYSICPKGWTLPTSAQYNTLISKYSTYSAMVGTPAFVLSGTRNSTTTYDQGSFGRYWTRTASGTDNAWYFSFGPSNAPNTSNLFSPKYLGMPIRCISQ